MDIKIPFYNVLNMLLTGVVFEISCLVIFPELPTRILAVAQISSFITEETILVEFVFLATTYEIGLIINRMGSVLIEPFFKAIDIISFDDDYVRFNEKVKIYPILTTLSREYAVSRTSVALFSILTVLSPTCKSSGLIVLFIIIVLTFVGSMRKFSQKIFDLMQT